MARGSHFAHVQRWHAASRRYSGRYFGDLFQAHHNVALGFEWEGLRVLAHLTPIKEKETLLIAPTVTPALRRAL
ncbi:MAG TPA: hypothetical protein VKU60_14765 [Chloroflexota bacterium]|nr:hypothetical protein [Chloroflexota bacterium]